MELDYTFSKIDVGDLEMLNQFLMSAGSSLNTFRYFQNRPLSVIENHLVTCLLINENQPVGYGHLDKDGDTVWLGIAVSEGFKGKGLGKLIMDFLISAARNNRLSKVKLTVDENNTNAISLYEKFSFVSLGNFKEDSILMELEILYE
jgi:ribosomal protein S18 acetylase RimI-like enzyme